MRISESDHRLERNMGCKMNTQSRSPVSLLLIVFSSDQFHVCVQQFSKIVELKSPTIIFQPHETGTWIDKTTTTHDI